MCGIWSRGKASMVGAGVGWGAPAALQAPNHLLLIKTGLFCNSVGCNKNSKDIFWLPCPHALFEIEWGISSASPLNHALEWSFECCSPSHTLNLHFLHTCSPNSDSKPSQASTTCWETPGNGQHQNSQLQEGHPGLRRCRCWEGPRGLTLQMALPTTELVSPPGRSGQSPAAAAQGFSLGWFYFKTCFVCSYTIFLRSS